MISKFYTILFLIFDICDCGRNKTDLCTKCQVKLQFYYLANTNNMKLSIRYLDVHSGYNT